MRELNINIQNMDSEAFVRNGAEQELQKISDHIIWCIKDNMFASGAIQDTDGEVVGIWRLQNV